MRRRFGLVLLAGLIVPLACAANASAQGASLAVSPAVASPGQVVTVTGSGYSQTGGGLSDAAIHLSTRNGQVLAEEPVDQANRFSTQFPVPNLAPGWYLLIGTQIVEANGRQKSFTPGRTRLRVVAAAKVGAGAAAPSGGDGGPSGPGMPLAIGSALILLAAGGLLAARRIHNRQPLGS